MALNARERCISLVAGAIAAYSMRLQDGSIGAETSLPDFVLRSVPDSVRSEVTAELIDDVFACVSSHGS